MANRYWVGGSGTWGSTTKWSASSGGASGASVPTAADTAIFDANSDAGLGAITVTLAANGVTGPLILTDLDQNLTFTGAFSLSVAGDLRMPTNTGLTVSVTGISSGSLTLNSSAQRGVYGNGSTLTGGIILNSPLDGITLQDNFSITGTFLLTSGSIVLSGNTLTIGAFNSTTTTATRSISWNTAGSNIIVNGTGTAPWNLVSATNLTLSAVSSEPRVELTNSSASTRIIRHTVGAASLSINFYIESGSDNVEFYAGSYLRNVDFTGFSGTWTSTAYNQCGDLTLSTGMTCASGANVVTIINWTATQTITWTTNGKSLNRPVTMTATATTAVLNLVEDLFVDAAFTFNLGRIDLNDYNIRCTTWTSSSGSNRIINFSYLNGFDTGAIQCTGASFVMTNFTNFSYNYTGRVYMTQATASGGTKTITCTGTVSYAQSLNFYVYGDVSGSNLALTSGSTYRTLDLTYATGSSALIGIGAFTLYGDFLLGGSSSCASTSTGTITFASTSAQGERGDGEQIVSMNATANWDRPVTKSASGTLTFASDIRMGTTTSRTFTHTAGTINLEGYSFTLFGTYSSSGSTARKITHGGYADIGYIGKIYLNAGASVTAWDTTTATNWTTDSVYGYHRVQVYVTGTGTKTLTFGGIVEGSTVDVIMNTTAGTNNISGGVNNLTLNNGGAYTLAIPASGTLTVYGDMTIVGNSPVLSFASGTITFGKTSGEQTLTSLGEVFNGPVVKNGAGTLTLNGNWQIGTAAAATGFTHTQGTIDIYGNIATIYGTFTSSNSNTRKLQNSFGNDNGSGGKILIINNSATTVYNATTSTGMTTDGNVLVEVQGTTNGVTVIPGSISEANFPPSFLNSRTSGTMTINAGNVKKLTANFTTAIATTLNIYDNLVIGSSGALSAVTSVTFAKSSGTQTITTNAKTLTSPSVVKEGAGSLQLADNLTLSAAFTLTQGTLNVGGYTFTCPTTFNSVNTNTRAITFTSGGVIVLSGSGTIWNFATPGNFTMNGVSLGKISCTSDSAKTFAGAGGTYCTLENTGTYTAGNLTITGSNSFYDITNATRPQTIKFEGGSTQTITNDLTLDGAYDTTISTYSSEMASTTKYVNYTAYTVDSTTGYTIECFIKFNTLSTTPTMTRFSLGTVSHPVFSANTTAINISNAGFSTRGTATGLTLQAGVWYHFAYYGIGATTYMAVNGVVYWLNNIGGANGYTPNGIWGNGFKFGDGPVVVSNIRLTIKGDIYPTSGTFSPPSYALTPLANTVLLTARSSTWIDLSTWKGPRTVTAVGSPTLITDTISGSAVTPSTNRITITSANTTPFTFTKPSGTVSVNYCDISYSTATGGASWLAYTSNGNLDSGNNTGWLFAPTSTYPVYNAMMMYF